MPLADHVQQVFLAEPHGDVSDHQRRQAVLLVQNSEEVDLVVFKRAMDGLHRCAAGLLLSLRLIYFIFGSLRLLIQIFKTETRLGRP